MLLGRLSPIASLGQVGRDFERLFSDFLPEVDVSARRVRAFPPLNIWEEGDVFHVEAELPGMKLENIDLEVLGNEFTLKGHREQADVENATYHRRERGTGEFTRVLTLPTEIDADKVEASLHDGVLTVKLPKAPSAKARKIQVKTIE